MRFFTLLAILLLSSIASAHHGSNGQFDHAKVIQVAGAVTKIRFVNPHSYVYFDVTDKDGEVNNWRCEMRAGSLLKRTGWTTEMFKEGTLISIEGSAARREEHGCYIKTISFGDGPAIERNAVLEKNVNPSEAVTTSVALAEGTPNINGNWVALPRERGARPARPEGAGNADGARPGGDGARPGGGGERPTAAAGGERAAAGGGRPAGGPPAGGRPRGPQYDQTEAGIAASAGFEREDNPRLQCKATNIFHDWTFDQHVNAIQQTNEKIVIQYGFMDIVRTIHLDMESHPENIEPSIAGHSIGSWDGDTLVVDTVGFAPGYLAATFAGVKHSDQLHVAERFSLSEDDKTLERTYTITDPLYLAKAKEGEDKIVRSTDAFDAYECDDLTEEVVKGF